jgi:HMG (high mobility group) box
MPVPISSLQDNPEVTKVSDMARHAGEAWRAIHPDKRAEYEKMSADNKVVWLLGFFFGFE